MKLLKITTSAVVLMLSAHASSADFDTDSQYFHVDGQSINATLSSVNQVICAIAAMRTDSLVNDGPYLATVYEEDCVVSAVDASKEAASAKKSSSQSATSATVSIGTASVDSKTAQTAVVQVTRLSSAAPSKASIWFKTPAKTTTNNHEWATKTFIDMSQTSGVTPSSPNGEFEMSFSSHIDGDQVWPWDENYTRDDGQVNGEGYIKASGSLLKFRESNNQGENNIAATFYPGGNKSGIYSERAGFDTWDWEANDHQSPEELGFTREDYPYTEVEAFYQFYLSTADKGYCRRLLSAERKQQKTDEQREALEAEAQIATDAFYDEANSLINEKIQALDAQLQSLDQDNYPTQDEVDALYSAVYDSVDWDSLQQQVDNLWRATGEHTLVQIYNINEGIDELADYGQSELVQGEECFTIDEAKVQRNVHRYGVYNLDGSRLSILNPPFSMVAQVTETLDDGSQEETEAYAWAGYWGTHLDQDARSLVTEDTVFEKEGFREDSDSTKQTYNLKSTDIRLEKRTTSYVALNDINYITLNMWIDDDSWDTQYTALFGGVVEYQELEGSFNKDTQTFTMIKGIKHDPFVEVDLTTTSPITFTVAQWQASMVKEWGLSVDGENNRVEEDWYHKETRNLGVWSHDTDQWYEISNEAMSSPASANRDAGIRTESSQIISAADMTETLYCISNCIDGAKVEQAFTQALDATHIGLIQSPYSDVSERLKSQVVATHVERGFRSFNEASDGFAQSITTNTDNQIVLGQGGIAITDYVSGNRNLPMYSRGNFSYADDEALRYFAWDGFSKGNLNSLLSYDNVNADATEVDRLLSTLPSVSIDLKSIPAAGASGTMTMIVSVYEGDNDQQDSGERAVAAEADLSWSSDGTNFQIAIDQGTPIKYTLLTDSNGIAVQTSYDYPRNSVFGYSGQELDIHQSALLNTGLRFQLFDLFVGSGKLQQLIDADFGAFFNGGGDFTASIQMLSTDLTVAVEYEDGGKTDALKKATLQFNLFNDQDILREETYEVGEWAEGLQIEDMASYTVVAGKFVDQNGNELKKGASASAALAAVDDPYSLLENALYPEDVLDDPAQADIATRTLGWGVHSGELIPASQLANLECRKNGKDQLYDSHPVYGDSTATRYCGNQLWNGGVTVKYSINVESSPQYEVFYANVVDTDAIIGTKVKVDEPKTMYYTVPETLNSDGIAVFGKDAGKRIRLEYNGHGELYGIPGFVYDTATNEDLGEHINEWKDSYRYLSRFIMPDGTLIQDGVDSTITYKVKALQGEVWLTKADGSIDGVGDLTKKYTDLYTGAVTDLVDRDTLKVLGFEDWGTFDQANGNWLNDTPDGINDNENYLGSQPTPTLNGGDTAVVHGVVIADPTP